MGRDMLQTWHIDVFLPPGRRVPPHAEVPSHFPAAGNAKKALKDLPLPAALFHLPPAIHEKHLKYNSLPPSMVIFSIYYICSFYVVQA